MKKYKKYLFTILLALCATLTWAQSSAGDPFYLQNNSEDDATFSLDFSGSFDFSSNPIYLEYSTDNENWAKVTGGWQGCPCSEEGSECTCISEGDECSCDASEGTTCDACTDNYSLRVSVPTGSKIYLRAQEGNTNTLAYSEDETYVNAISTIGFEDIEDEQGEPTVIPFTVGGDITTLITQNGNVESLGANYFAELFSGKEGLTDASDLILPSTTLAADCYISMFNGCTALTATPALPATTLAAGCYSYMFSGCTALTTINNIAASRSAITDTYDGETGNYCTAEMFSSVGSEYDDEGNPLEVTATLNNLDVADLVLGTATSISTVDADNYTSVTITDENNEETTYNTASEYVFNYLKTDGGTYSSIFENTKFTLNGTEVTEPSSEDPSDPGESGGDEPEGNNAFAGGDGSQDNPYQISNKQQMANLIDLLDATKTYSDFDDVSDQYTIGEDTYYLLTGDLDYSNGASYFLYDGTKALGNDKAMEDGSYIGNFGTIDSNTDPATENTTFRGHFDGGNHTIAGIKGFNGGGTGLFYKVSSTSTFSNLAVVNSYSLFGVAPASTGYTFNNCYFSFSPRVDGENDAVTITSSNCYWIENGSIMYGYFDDLYDDYKVSTTAPDNSDVWQTDALAMDGHKILKSLAITLKGDDGNDYVTDKLMRQPKNNVMLYEETPTAGTEYKYNVYTSADGGYTIQNLYLTDFSELVYNWESVKSNYDSNYETAAAATSLVWNHSESPKVYGINYKRIDTTYKGSNDSWNTFYLPFAVDNSSDENNTDNGTAFHYLHDSGDNLIEFGNLSSNNKYKPAGKAFIFNPNYGFSDDQKSSHAYLVDYCPGIAKNKIDDTNDYELDLSIAYYDNDNWPTNFTGNDLSTVAFDKNGYFQASDVFTGTLKLETGTNLSQGQYTPVNKKLTYYDNASEGSLDIFTYKLNSSLALNYTVSGSWLYPFRAILQLPAVATESGSANAAKASTALSIVFSTDGDASVTTGIKPSEATVTDVARKALKNGRLVIEKNGKAYTVAGQQL